MAKRVQFRGGTEDRHNVFVGAPREVTVDTTNKTLRVHDGETVGGIPMAKESPYKIRDIYNLRIIVNNYTDGFFSAFSQQMFEYLLTRWLKENEDWDNTSMQVADWNNAIYIVFTSFLTDASDVKISTLTQGVS